MSYSQAAHAAQQSSRPASVEPPTTLADSVLHLSSRTLNSSSRLSNYTYATTRRSSFQSAHASFYQDTEDSLAFDDASQGYDQPDLDSDLDIRSQRTPSRAADRSLGATSPFQASITRGASADALQTTLNDAPDASVPALTSIPRRRSSYKRQSVDLSRPLSSLSRHSSASAITHDDPQLRLRDAATAAANRSSTTRRLSVEIDQLAYSISRASTPHAFRSQDDDDDDATSSQPRSRPGSSLALRKYDQDNSSFIKRDPAKDRSGSILPPAAFFAPQKPAARNSTSNLLASASSTGAGRSTTPLSFYSTASPAQHAEQEVLERSTLPMRAPVRHTRSPSPWGFAPEAHSIDSSSQRNPNASSGVDRTYSQTTDGTVPLHPLDASDGFPTSSTHPSPRSVVRLMASTDPLLPARAIPDATTTGSPNPSNDHSTHTAGLGFDTAPTTTKSNHPVAEQRASLPSAKRRSSTQNANIVNGTTATPPTSAATTEPVKRLRNYRTHQGSNNFLLCGLLITSSDNPLPFVLSFVFLLLLGALFYGFEAAWLTLNISPAIVATFSYVYLQAIVNMLVTAFRDPGILPRNLDPDPPCVLADTPFESGRHALVDPEDALAIPVQRVLRIRGQTVQVKWCETCGTYRPPRSSHCRVCDNCVENIDHHCTYLNTCIGRRNYVSFMVFLSTSILSALYVVACTTARLVLMTRHSGYRYPSANGDVTARGLSLQQALKQSPVSALLFLLCVGATAPVLVLFTYHVRLVLLNRSTVEQIRINTSRKYGGGQKQVELGTHADDASMYGAHQGGKGATSATARLAIRTAFEKLGVLQPRYKDPNPFATASKKTNVRNALGWRSVQLDSWIDRRGLVSNDDRKPHPRVRTQDVKIEPNSLTDTRLEWKA
ncbi:uncharacterized protein UMAG_10704 [Mycosarcoma maydis]|uniref:Palmitoyltransferase n=1 Tax=Mycosarcoma maydis TaxID=5270 RepID=A0A0D1DSD4_MYCMD|nr:uncharacterized protein UMAG_10704 [Ustilago maydis 521]KIS66781.1 hypothetical protein UMAG_10704 [Ustilago maydis 521]|eukprot:XP_011391756.1 hypothetical protein UMAG_10704 [Ustilago maydis 521]